MPLDTILADLKTQGNYRRLKTLTHEGQYVYFKGQKLLNLAGNDYLHLTKDEGLKDEFLRQLDAKDFYLSSSSSRSLSGNFSIYEKFESSLAKSFQNKEVLHFNSGYHLNLSCIQALSTLPNTLLIADKLIHASVIDGLRLGGSRFLRFKHNDLESLENLLKQYHKDYEHIIIITEALFSMNGDFAPLKELTEFKKRYQNILLYVDEAHSVGCFDESGLGYAKSLGLDKKIDCLVFTFGKAIASVGACMLCSSDFKAFFINKARAFIYSTALPPLNVAWSHFIFANLARFHNQRQNLHNISHFFKDVLLKQGFKILGDEYIISLLCGSNAKADMISNNLLQGGIFAPAIKEPTIPKGTSRIRFSLNAALNEAHIESIIKALL